MMRKTILGWAVALAFALAPPAAGAQTYPDKPIKIIVPFAPGGTADILARVLGESLSKELGQPVLVENRGGAGGNIGSEIVARQSAPDGHTLLINGVGLASNVTIYKTLPFDPLKDLRIVAVLAEIPMMVAVAPQLPAQNLQDLIRLAKAEPGKLTFASSGVGTTTHLAGELFKSATKTDLLHIAYRSTSQAMTDLSTGRIQVVFDFLTSESGANPGRADPAAGHQRRQALAAAAGRADRRRGGRAGLSIQRLGRADCAGADARRDHRQIASRHGKDRAVPRLPPAPRSGRQRNPRPDAGAPRCNHAAGDRALGPRRQGRRLCRLAIDFIATSLSPEHFQPTTGDNRARDVR